MSLALYIKEDTFKKRLLAKRRDRAFFILIAFLGFTTIIFTIYPFIYWQLKTLPKLTTKISEVPVPNGSVLSEKSTLAANVQVVKDPDGFSYFSTNFQPQDVTRPKSFSLSIPKLKIKDAVVKVDTLTFYENLALFPGTALPGQIGNSFISGHSVLPEFNDPANYRTIFTKLSDLEVGDEVIATIEGKTYNYSVQYSKIVDPQDLSVITPIYPRARNLTLMTCVPPGTSSKRLVVITSLI